MYRWFLAVHKVCFFVGTVGCLGLVLDMLGLVEVLPPAIAVAPFFLLFYGLYFGVLSRDCAEWSAETISLNLGVRRMSMAYTRCLCVAVLTIGAAAVAAS